MRAFPKVATSALVSISLTGLLLSCSPHEPATRSAAEASLEAYDATGISEATQTSRFGGFSNSAATRTVTAYRTAAATRAELAVVHGVGLPAGFKLRVVQVRQSWSTLERLERTLPDRLPASLKAVLSEVAIDPRANGLDVGLTVVSPGSRVALRKVLGKSLAKVFRADRGTAL